MYWSQLSTLIKVGEVVGTVIAFGAIFYCFFCGHISRLLPRKK
jgi:hypothetical protein